MKYRSHWPTNILRSDFGSYWLIIPNYDVQPLNSFPDIWKTHWTMKYRWQWPTFIFRSNGVSYWLIIPKYGVHTSNSLQDIRQNHWTMKYRSQWLTFILRSNIGSYTHNPEVWCSYMKESSRYKAKSLDYEIYVTVTYIYFEVTQWVILTHNPKVWCSYIK